MIGRGQDSFRRLRGDGGRGYRRGPEVNEDRSRKGMVEGRVKDGLGFGGPDRRRNDGRRHEEMKGARRWPADDLNENRYGRGDRHDIQKQRDGRQEERHIQKVHERVERKRMEGAEGVVDAGRKSEDRIDGKHDRRWERVERGFEDSERRSEGPQDEKRVRRLRAEERHEGSERDRRQHEEKWAREDRGTEDYDKRCTEKVRVDRHAVKESKVVVEGEGPVTDDRHEVREARDGSEERHEAGTDQWLREERQARGRREVSSLPDLGDNTKDDQRGMHRREDLIMKDNDKGHKNAGGKCKPELQDDNAQMDTGEEFRKNSLVESKQSKKLRDSEAHNGYTDLLTGTDKEVQRRRGDDDEMFWSAGIDQPLPASPRAGRQDSPPVQGGGAASPRALRGGEEKQSMHDEGLETDKKNECRVRDIGPDRDQSRDLDTICDQDVDMGHDYDRDRHERDHDDVGPDQDRDWDLGHSHDRDLDVSQEQDPDHMWDREQGRGWDRNGQDWDPGQGMDRDRDRDAGRGSRDQEMDRISDQGPRSEAERAQESRVSVSPRKEDKRCLLDLQEDDDWPMNGRDGSRSKMVPRADHKRTERWHEEEKWTTDGEPGRKQGVSVDDEPGSRLRGKRPREQYERRQGGDAVNDRGNEAVDLQPENHGVDLNDGDCDLTVDRGKARYEDPPEKSNAMEGMSGPVKNDPSEGAFMGGSDRAGPGVRDGSPTSTKGLTSGPECTRPLAAPLPLLEGSRKRTLLSSTPPIKEDRDVKHTSLSRTPPIKEDRDVQSVCVEPRSASDVEADHEVGDSRNIPDVQDPKMSRQLRGGRERGDGEPRNGRERDGEPRNGRKRGEGELRDGRERGDGELRDGRERGNGEFRDGRERRDGEELRDGRERDGEIRNGRERGEEDLRDGRERGDGRNVRNGRDNRDCRSARDGRGIRDGREVRDSRDVQDGWNGRNARDMRDTRDAHMRNMRDGRDGRDGWEKRTGPGRDGGRSGNMGGRRGRRPSLSPARLRRRLRSRSPAFVNHPGTRRRSPWRPRSPVRRSPPPLRRSPGGHASPQRNRGVGRPGNNLFVAGFNYITSERDLERKFSRFGRVTNVRIVRDNSRTQESRGFGFVTLERDENADEAIRALDGTNWNGRVVLVEKAKSAPRR